MTPEFPAIGCFSASVVSFACAITMRKRKAAEAPPARQKKIRAASWLFFFAGLFLLAGGILFEIAGLK